MTFFWFLISFILPEIGIKRLIVGNYGDTS